MTMLEAMLQAYAPSIPQASCLTDATSNPSRARYRQTDKLTDNLLSPFIDKSHLKQRARKREINL